MLEITLPFPPKELSPNGRGHWSKVSKAKRGYRTTCYWLALIEKNKANWSCEHDVKIALELNFYMPDKRFRDDDNLEASFKAGRDGLADALCVNDRHFKVTRIIHPQVVPTGKIVVRLEKPSCSFPA